MTQQARANQPINQELRKKLRATGVGLSGNFTEAGAILIYLTEDTEAKRAEVLQVAGDIPVDFKVTREIIRVADDEVG